MKKAIIVTLNKEQTQALQALRSLGVLHIRPLSHFTASDQLHTLQQQKDEYEKAIRLLPPEDSTKSIPTSAPEAIRQQVLSIHDQIRQLKEESTQWAIEYDRVAFLGNFSTADIDYLQKNNLFLYLIQIPAERFSAFSPPENAAVFEISRTKTLITCAVFSKHAKLVFDHPAKFLSIPNANAREISEKINQNTEKINTLEQQLHNLANAAPLLNKAIDQLTAKIEFESAICHLEQSDSLAAITGFIPLEKAAALQKAAAAQQWACAVLEPEPDDKVPTLLKNSGWVRIIQPVFDLLGTLPGYSEYDISTWFLLFFALFFAIIIGDAGYGGILLGITLFAKTKVSKDAPKEPLTLLVVMSICTIIWGAITGTWFGSEKLAQLPFLSWMIIQPIYSFSQNSAEVIKLMTFIIGTIHISLARLISFIRQLPDLKAYAQLGWMSLIVGAFFLVLNLVLDAQKYPLLNYHLILILSGLVIIVLFSEQQGNFIKGALHGLASLPLKILNGISAFSDIISYIRLFAVGLATIEIAKSFNDMAGGLSGGILGMVIAAIVLVIGHSLNMAMAALSVIVHGVRLKMLEFSGHIGMEWTGYPYQPFKEPEIEGEKSKELIK
jgi:V/A-type H+-transporting ATPase subunit I